MALTTRDLEAGGCDTPNCRHDHSTLFVTPRCHPNRGVDVSYIKGKGIVRVHCHRCQALVVEIAVKEPTVH